MHNYTVIFIIFFYFQQITMFVEYKIIQRYVIQSTTLFNSIGILKSYQ